MDIATVFCKQKFKICSLKSMGTIGQDIKYLPYFTKSEKYAFCSSAPPLLSPPPLAAWGLCEHCQHTWVPGWGRMETWGSRERGRGASLECTVVGHHLTPLPTSWWAAQLRHSPATCYFMAWDHLLWSWPWAMVTCVFEFVRVGALPPVRPALFRSIELLPPLKCKRQLFGFCPSLLLLAEWCRGTPFCNIVL